MEFGRGVVLLMVVGSLAVAGWSWVSVARGVAANPLLPLPPSPAAPGSEPTPPIVQVIWLPPATATPAPLTPIPAPLTFRVTERIAVGGLAFEIKEVGFSTIAALSPFTEDDGKRSVLVVDLVLESFRVDRRAQYGPSLMLVRDAEGFESRATTFNTVRSLKQGEISFGERVRGEVYFVVPTGAKGFTLSFAVGLSADPSHYQWVRVPLGI